MKLKRAAVGRTLKYKSILKSLNPSWCYTAASIARFAQQVGLLNFIETEDIGKEQKYRRVRASMGRRRSDWRYPSNGDQWILLDGSYYPSWYGWRWQWFSNQRQGTRAVKSLLRPLLVAMGREAYTKMDLINIWRRLPDNQDVEEAGIFEIQIALALTRHMAEHGLSEQQAYHRNTWRGSAPQGASIKELRPTLILLERNRTYGIEDLIQIAKGQQARTPREITKQRIALYQLAQSMNFPEMGDELLPGFTARWRGYRWLRGYIKFFSANEHGPRG